MRVWFTDFWSDFEPTTFPLWQQLQELGAVLAQPPELLIFSVFGTDHRNYSCPRLLFSGENLHYKGGEFIPAADFVISVNSDIGYYIPYPILFNNLPEMLEHWSKEKRQKTKFCCFVATNGAQHWPGCAFQTELMLALSRYKKVDCAGPFLQNCPLAPREKRYPGVHIDVDWLSQYKFVICGENTFSPGYFTEKIIQPFYAHSVPLYKADDSYQQLINPEAVITGTVAEIVEQVKKLDQDDALYLAKQKVCPLQVNVELGPGVIKRTLQQILPQCQRKFLTFDQGNKKIVKEAVATKFFKQYTVHEDIDYDWLKKIGKEPEWLSEEGYGREFWKPFMILEELEEMQDGEILVYVDNQLQITSEKWRGWIQEFQQHDLLVFCSSEKENEKSCQLLQMDELEILEYGSGKQISTSLQLWKKTVETVALVQEWVKYVTEAPDVSNGIFSLLVKRSSVKRKIYDSIPFHVRTVIAPEIVIRRVPKIYCINLPDSVGRRERITKRFMHHGLPYTFVKAIPKTASLIEYYGAGIPEKPGVVACFASHLKALREFLETEDKAAIICEDDAQFHNNFVNMLMERIDNLPDAAPLLAISYSIEHWIGFQWTGKNPALENLQGIVSDHTWGTVCYYISREYAMDVLRKYDRPFVELQGYRTSELIVRFSKGYICQPILALEEMLDSAIGDEQYLAYHARYFSRYNKEEYLDGDQ